jgi:hypothetical protein
VEKAPVNTGVVVVATGKAGTKYRRRRNAIDSEVRRNISKKTAPEAPQRRPNFRFLCALAAAPAEQAQTKEPGSEEHERGRLGYAQSLRERLGDRHKIIGTAAPVHVDVIRD